MSKTKYRYNAESCQYEPIKVSATDVFINLFLFLFISSLIGLGIFFVSDTYFESPSKAALRKENEELKLYYDILEKDMQEVSEMISLLEKRDDDIYRVIYGVEPIPKEIRSAGVGGSNRYKDLVNNGLEREELILSNLEKIDHLKKKMYIQTKSYDDIVDMAKNRQEMLSSLPAIQPVSNKGLKRLASGFGMRMHPIYKVRRMHTGTDFSLPLNNPVYATGGGVVEFTKTKFSGYGKHIRIKHGFGYRTLYAHLSEFLVKPGQKVKRGQIIGYSGNIGGSTAPHLHYEVIKDGKKVNPVNYFYQDISENEYNEIVRLSSIENQSLGNY